MERYTRATVFVQAERRRSQEVYEHIQTIIYLHDEAELSCFRLLGSTWVVVVVGEIPPEHIDRLIMEQIYKGVRVSIPEDMEDYLYARRQKVGKNVVWIESHRSV